MKIIDLIIKIANKEELPQTIEYNGDIGKLVQENDFINYIFERDGNIYDLYWLIEHNLNNVNDEVFERKLK
jgi:hypothetical protein